MALVTACNHVLVGLMPPSNHPTTLQSGQVLLTIFCQPWCSAWLRVDAQNLFFQMSHLSMFYSQVQIK